LGPSVRQGDSAWADVVRWSLYAMIQGEEFGITSANIDQIKTDNKNPDIARFLGTSDEVGKGLGLPNDFAYQVIKQVGNYGDSFERNVGHHSKIGLDRGLNDIWFRGGLMYAIPMR
jgi:general L-amino acid transport system substrate-binding protein